MAVAVGAAVVLAVAVVLAARGLRALPAVQAFVARYPGEAPLPADAPVGFPAWLAVQHALNALFLLFTVRSGWRLHRAGRPTTFWTRRNTGLVRTRNPPVRIALDLWSHYVADTLWVLNGVVFLVLLLTTGQWLRIVPTSPAIVPAALSTALQYVSLDWPTTDGWVDYNGLQALSYFSVVFVAGPLVTLTGLRLAPGFAARLRFLDRVLPLRATRALHLWTMVFLVVFTAGHVLLVLATGALRNLNHLYALRDDTSPVGLLVFLGTLVVTALVVLAVRPGLVQRSAARTGDLLERPARPRR
ncbi:cytochrome b/b6 domain-containing protein [Amnibacterium sp. CER49]|uniref:cytochrome b/b6 domain-containing protein n=1 Tax=Amnibacterium sp. CER49 TaxID=3039161 RepID=UPI00244D60D0|nr:cytochrome b/b6 domain-containing protein [Amnibacterium sp. CER49]MDH2442882.1 cytochrome b/b6 domain-containing protein [Amnibacterium sp. CER49]